MARLFKPLSVVMNMVVYIIMTCQKDTINIYSWQYGSTYNMNDDLNKKKMYLYLKNQTEKSTVVEWNESMNS